MANPLLKPVLAYASRLRYPQLFLVTAAIFVVDLIIPDVLPFADEILLGLGTLLLGSMKLRRSAPADAEDVEVVDERQRKR